MSSRDDDGQSGLGDDRRHAAVECAVGGINLLRTCETLPVMDTKNVVLNNTALCSVLHGRDTRRKIDAKGEHLDQ